MRARMRKGQRRFRLSPAKLAKQLKNEANLMDKKYSNTEIDIIENSLLNNLRSKDKFIRENAYKELMGLRKQGLSNEEILINTGSVDIKIPKVIKSDSSQRELIGKIESIYGSKNNENMEPAQIKRRAEARVKQLRQRYMVTSSSLSASNLQKSISHIGGDLRELIDASIAVNGQSYFSSKVNRMMNGGNKLNFELSILLSSDDDEYQENFDTISSFFEFDSLLDKIKDNQIVNGKSKEEIKKLLGKFAVEAYDMMDLINPEQSNPAWAVDVLNKIGGLNLEVT